MRSIDYSLVGAGMVKESMRTTFIVVQIGPTCRFPSSISPQDGTEVIFSNAFQIYWDSCAKFIEILLVRINFRIDSNWEP